MTRHLYTVHGNSVAVVCAVVLVLLSPLAEGQGGHPDTPYGLDPAFIQNPFYDPVPTGNQYSPYPDPSLFPPNYHLPNPNPNPYYKPHPRPQPLYNQYPPQSNFYLTQAPTPPAPTTTPAPPSPESSPGGGAEYERDDGVGGGTGGGGPVFNQHVYRAAGDQAGWVYGSGGSVGTSDPAQDFGAGRLYTLPSPPGGSTGVGLLERVADPRQALRRRQASSRYTSYYNNIANSPLLYMMAFNGW